MLPGETSQERRAFCKRKVMQAVEALDDKLPLVGLLADCEIIDALEKQLVADIVDRALDGIEH